MGSADALVAAVLRSTKRRREVDECDESEPVPRPRKAGEGKTYSCDVCGNTYDKPARLARHVRTHTGEKPYACSEPGCRAAFARKDRLVRHMYSHAPSSELPHSCNECGKAFYEASHLKRHRQIVHAPGPYVCDHPVDPTGGPNDTSAASTALGAGSFPGGPSSAEEGPASATPAGHRPCGAAFAKKTQLRAHVREAHGLADWTPHACAEPGCGRAFPSLSKLRRHGECHSAAKARFVCSEAGCGASFGESRQLTAHLREAHPFVCGECGKAFAAASLLQAHEQTHVVDADGGPVRCYMCSVGGCMRAFAQKRNLLAHQRAVHDEEGRRRFPCDVPGCGDAFAYKHVLANHMRRVHARGSLVCGVDGCRKTFTDKQRFTFHQKAVHFDAAGREFRCEVEGCDSAFAYKHLVDNHMQAIHGNGSSSTPPPPPPLPSSSSSSSTAAAATATTMTAALSSSATPARAPSSSTAATTANAATSSSATTTASLPAVSSMPLGSGVAV